MQASHGAGFSDLEERVSGRSAGSEAISVRIPSVPKALVDCFNYGYLSGGLTWGTDGTGGRVGTRHRIRFRPTQ